MIEPVGITIVVFDTNALQNLKYYHGTQIISLAQFARLFGLA